MGNVLANTLVESCFIYLEGMCTQCGGAMPMVIELPGFYPMSIRLDVLRPVDCRRCGKSSTAGYIFGTHEFETHCDLQPFFRRAYKVCILVDGTLVFEEDIPLEEAWNRRK